MRISNRVINKKRHKLLKLLTGKRIDVAFEKKEDELSIKIKDLMVKLKCTRSDLHLITCGLVVAKEVVLLAGIKDEDSTFYIEDVGVTSYTNNKYLKLYQSFFWNLHSKTVLIIVSVLSLINFITPIVEYFSKV